MQGRTTRTISFHDLLYFEPYSCLSQELITQLFDDVNAKSEISDAFLHDCAKVTFKQMDQLKNILLWQGQESEYLGAIRQCHDQYYDDPIFQCYELYRTWKKSTEEPTYNGLRKAIDKYRIFFERNLY